MLSDHAAPRTHPELEGLELALRASHGAAPDWLSAELAGGRTPALEFGPRELRSLMGALLSVACLLAAFDVCVSVDAVAFDAPRLEAPAPAPLEPDAREAIAMAQDWKMSGDERTVRQRLSGFASNSGDARAWSAERTGEGSFLVIFREPAGVPAYAFEVDLADGRVLATPEAVERLTLMRLRDEVDTRLHLVASAR